MVVFPTPPIDQDLSLPQQMDDLFWGISLPGHGLASFILALNPNLTVGPVFGGWSPPPSAKRDGTNSHNGLAVGFSGVLDGAIQAANAAAR